MRLVERKVRYPRPYWALLNNGEHKTFDVLEDGVSIMSVLTGVDRRANRLSGKNQGYFALFHATHDCPDAAKMLFDGVREFQSSARNDRFVGPVNPDGSGFEMGIMTEGFGLPKELLNPVNPPYFGALMTHAGLIPSTRYIGYQLNLHTLSLKRYSEASGRACERSNITIDEITLRRGKSDYRRLYEATEAHGHIPLDVFAEQIDRIKPFLHPKLLLVASVKAQPAGMIMALHDKKNRAYRVTTLYVVQKYRHTPVALCLFGELVNRLARINASNITASTIDETNLQSLASIKNAGGIAARIWQMYECTET